MTTTNACDVTRRDFLKTTGAATAFATFFAVTNGDALTTGENSPDAVTAAAGQSIVYRFSVCQNCHSRCGLMAKIVGPTGSTDPAAGVLVKLDGNPYHPNNMEDDGERLTYATSVTTAQNTRGRLCPKGQAGVQVLYDPYRIKHPLKRVGSRGSGQWQAISWSTAWSEIATKINSLILNSTRLTADIDSTKTFLGKKANQLMFAPGRTTDGEIIERFFKNYYGTVNYRLDHTSICETSHHVANRLMTWNETGNTGRKDHFKPDIMNSEYMILFGVNYLEANFPMLALARKTSYFKSQSGRTLVVVDPRMSNTAAKANTWIAPKPGTDAAVALGMVWRIMDRIISNDPAAEVQNAIKYLRNPGSVAAITGTGGNEATFSDATHLVNTAQSTSGLTIGKYLTCADVNASYGLTSSVNKVVCTNATGPVLGDAVPTAAAAALLLPGALTINKVGAGTVTAKTVFQLLKEEVYDNKSVDYYAQIAGVDATTLQTIADAFLAKGKKAVANAYRGSVQHTNGVQTMRAIMLLNTLVGNYDWKGGNYSGAAGGWSYDSGGSGNMKTGGGTAYSPAGPRLDRAEGYKYGTGGSAAFNGWYNTNYAGGAAYTSSNMPATRPWGPYWYNGNYQEIIPSIAAQYPYACKVLITYWNAFPYSVPALKNVFISTVTDESKVPFLVAIDNVMGEVASYADYILPDTTYLERWSFPGNVMQLTKETPLRQPLVGSFDSKAWDASFVTTDTNDYKPIYPDTKMFEDILTGLKDALAAVGSFSPAGASVTMPTNAWAHNKIGVDNLATSSSQTASTIISKGGVFEDPGNAYYGSYLKYGYGTIDSGTLLPTAASPIKIYSEELATVIDTMGTAAEGNWDATAAASIFSDVKTNRFNPLPSYDPVRDSKDNAMTDLSYPFQLITYKKVLHGQARTQNLAWLTCWQPENFIDMNASDAASLGLKTYDRARVSSASSVTGIVGRVNVTQGLRPGVVAISHHFGHWEQSSKPWTATGSPSPSDSTWTVGTQSYDSSRSLGIQPNLVMRLDPQLGDVSLQDKVGGSVSFYDTRVKVEKV